MKAYDCDGQELSIGDDVIYISKPNMSPGSIIGKIYKILNIVYDHDYRTNISDTGIVFEYHPYNYGFYISNSAMPKYYKKIDYTKKLNDCESDQNSNETPAFKLAL